MRTSHVIILAVLFGAVGVQHPADAQAVGTGVSRDTALSVATMLQSARSVIGHKQGLINDPAIGDKGLTGESVLAESIDAYIDAAGTDPREIDPDTLEGQLLSAQMDAIRQVMEEIQGTINREGIGFKGFVPAVFARLVNERFREEAGDLANVKVTAPPHLVRNRKSRPDLWEEEMITSKLAAADWPVGDVLDAEVDVEGRGAFRVLVPEYYNDGCLSCHGTPAGEIDITGYPKEGGALDDLGGVISITLFR